MNEVSVAEDRDRSIDLLKCAAVLCIFNAHSTMLYPKWQWLSTGGYVGDALFFFCSGFTLLMNGGRGLCRFDHWYKRRLSRMWPSCLAWGIVAYFAFGRVIGVKAALWGQIGWFVHCILIFYALIWLIGRYCMRWMKTLFVLSCVCACLMLTADQYFGFPDGRLWSYPFFFPVMLLGALVGSEPRSYATNTRGGGMLAVQTLVAFLLFSGVIALGTRIKSIPQLRYFQVAGFPLVLLFVISFYRAASVFAERVPKGAWKPILWVGGLCLDFYLVKWSFITGRLTFMFPLNIPVVLFYLLVLAYLNRSLGRIIQQTMERGKKPYDWHEIFKL